MSPQLNTSISVLDGMVTVRITHLKFQSYACHCMCNVHNYKTRVHRLEVVSKMHLLNCKKLSV